jgi:hypothetical protein
MKQTSEFVQKCTYKKIDASSMAKVINLWNDGSFSSNDMNFATCDGVSPSEEIIVNNNLNH